MRYLTDETICGHFGEEGKKPYNAVVPPLYLNSLHTFDTIEKMLFRDPEEEIFVYGRVSNPTTDLFEKKIGALERGTGALAFASGMAAISSCILACIEPGGHIVAATNCYGVTYRFLTVDLKEKYNIETTFISGEDPKEFENAIRENTQLFYLESPTSMVFKLQDLAAVTAIAKARGIKSVIDNTWATPLYQKPLTLGVDISVHTVSKYIGGHSDMIGGVAAFADEEMRKRVQHTEREVLGGIMSPFDAWLATRGLRSLPARMRAHSANAMEIARRLHDHPKIERVLYPGHPSHPQYELAKTQMTGFTGLMSIIPKASPKALHAFMNAMQLFQHGVSWGGFESLAVFGMYSMTEEEARKVGGSPSIIRLAIGTENVEDLWDDLERALETI